MNLIKSQDYFSPVDVKKRCHIIGCGSVGSTVANLLARLGIKKISLYDFDTVSAHNIANQMFVDADIKRLKVDAVKDMIIAINPEAAPMVETYNEGWKNGTRLNGYVFLCVDNIDLRREIVKKNLGNTQVLAMFDFRTRLEDAQHYAADWKDPKSVQNLLKSMDFSHEEAKAETPVTACNVEMGVAPTVWSICTLGVANFMNFINEKPLKKQIFHSPFDFDTDAY
jgi:hypothetical protein